MVSPSYRHKRRRSHRSRSWSQSRSRSRSPRRRRWALNRTHICVLPETYLNCFTKYYWSRWAFNRTKPVFYLNKVEGGLLIELGNLFVSWLLPKVVCYSINNTVKKVLNNFSDSSKIWELKVLFWQPFSISMLMTSNQQQHTVCDW